MTSADDRSQFIKTSGSPIPLYEQVRLDLLDRMNKGEWPPGEMLPTEMALIESYGVSRVTIRRAIAELVRSGYLLRRAGKGTFVRERSQYYIPDGMLGFPEHAKAVGDDASFIVEVFEDCPVPVDEAGLLEIEPGTPVRHVLLKRLVDERVVGWQEIFLLAEAAEGFDQPLIEAHQDRIPLLNLTGFHITQRIARMRARRAEAFDVKHLGCQLGDPILFLQVVSIVEDLGPVAINRISHHGDLYEYHYNIVSD